MDSLTETDDSLDYLRSPGRKRRVVAAMALCLVAGGGLFAADRYKAAHQPLWVTNGSPESLTLQLGEAEYVLPAGEALRLELASGEHLARFRGALEEDVALRIAPDAGQRWRGRAVYVLNPGGLAAVVWEEARYGPGDGDDDPPRLLPREPFLRVADVDLLGAPFPETTGGRRLTRLVHLGGDPQHVATRLPCELAERLAYLEAHVLHLRRCATPPGGEAGLLTAYRALAEELGEGERLRRTLSKGLRQSSSVTYHRAYQDVELAAGAGDDLLAHYDTQLGSSNTAKSNYLVGRLRRNPRHAEADYRAALGLDPEFAWAHHGLAYLLAGRGDFRDAVAAARRAVELDSQRPEFAEVLWLARLGAGEAGALFDELGFDPYAPRKGFDMASERRALELVAILDPDRLLQALEAFRAGLPTDAELAEYNEEFLAVAAGTVAELAGDGEGLLAAAEALQGTRARRFRLLGLAVSGRFAELQTELAQGTPWELLRASFHAAQAGDGERAVRWRDAAAEGFRARGPKGQALADGLTRAAVQPDQLPLPPRDGALYCAVLAQLHPEREAYRADARQRLLGALAPARAVRAFLGE